MCISSKLQRGSATLLVSVILLISVTIISFVAARAVINEKRVFANEERAMRAFEAAQAGLSAGITYFRTDATLPTSVAPASGVVVSGAAETYQYYFEEIPGEVGKYSLVSIGFSDDRSSRRQITLVVLTPPALPNFPENPVVTGGLLNATGNFDVTNESGNLTIWSGDAISLGGSAETRVPGPGDNLVIGSNRDFRGGDIVDSDPSLATPSDEDFERAFIGNAVSDICIDDGSSNDITIDVFGKTNTQVSNEIQSIIYPTDGVTEASVFVCLKDSTGSDIALPSDIGRPPGSAEGYDGKIVIIQGNYRQTSNVVAAGVVYVTGDMTQGAGTPTVFGSLIVRGDVNLGNGTYSVIFNTSMTDKIGNEGAATGVPGTWRDW